MVYKITFSTLLALCLVSTALAEKNASIKPKIGSVDGAPTTQTFDSKLASPFSGVKGEWKILDGVLYGKELPADEHAAVLNCNIKNHNSVVRFSFKFDGKTNGFNFSLNHRGGHLFRVAVSSSALSVRLDKDKKDPKSKPELLGSAKGNFEPGTWYTIQVEMIGDRVVAQTDNKLVVESSHSKLDTPKPNYRFVMKGDSLAIDDLQIWDLK